MRPTRAADTRETLILTAERLWGDRGIDAVSLREIAAAAGQANTAAVHYHFGDRAGLVDAVFAYRLPAFEERRRALLQAAIVADAPPGAATLLDCMFRPFLEQRDAAGRHSYATFQRQVLRSPAAQASRLRLLETTPATIDILDRLAAALPPMHPALARRRLLAAIIVVMELICDADAGQVEGRGLTMATLYDDAIAIMGDAMMQPTRSLGAEAARPLSGDWYRD